MENEICALRETNGGRLEVSLIFGIRKVNMYVVTNEANPAAHWKSDIIGSSLTRYCQARRGPISHSASNHDSLEKAKNKRKEHTDHLRNNR